MPLQQRRTGKPKRTRNLRSEWPDRLTAKDAATAISVTRQTLWKMQKAGCPINEDGTYPLIPLYAYHLRAEIDKATGKDRNAEETRRIAALADTYEFKLAVMRGEYIKADLVASLWADRVTAARVGMMSLGSALGPSVVGHDAAGAKKLIDIRAREVLNDLSREFERALQDAEDEASDDS